MRNKSKDNGKYIVEPFTHQDMSLVLAYNRIRKFEIKKKEDLKHGVYVNVRETIALRNIYCPVIRLDGRYMDDGCNGWLIHIRASQLTDQYDTYSVTRNGVKLKGKQAERHKLKTDGYVGGGMYVDTMIRHNRSFKYNTKVVQFFELLKTYPLFQQHCILNNKAYTRENYDEFVNYVEDQKAQEDAFNAVMRASDQIYGDY